MSKLIPLSKLIRAINAHGFEVSLRPMGEPAVAPKSSGMAARVDAAMAQPETETVEVHGTEITRVVGSVTEDAPHGTDTEGKPLAPFGMLKDGSRPRKSPAGRPSAKSKASKPASKAQSGGFSLDLGDVLGGAAATPTPAPAAPPAAPEPSEEEALDDLELSLAGL